MDQLVAAQQPLPPVQCARAREGDWACGPPTVALPGPSETRPLGYRPRWRPEWTPLEPGKWQLCSPHVGPPMQPADCPVSDRPRIANSRIPLHCVAGHPYSQLHVPGKSSLHTLKSVVCGVCGSAFERTRRPTKNTCISPNQPKTLTINLNTLPSKTPSMQQSKSCKTAVRFCRLHLCMLLSLYTSPCGFSASNDNQIARCSAFPPGTLRPGLKPFPLRNGHRQPTLTKARDLPKAGWGFGP